MRRAWIVLILAGCGGMPRYRPHDPPPEGLEPRPGAYGSQDGVVLANAGVATSAVGAQMLRKDDTLFDRLPHKRTYGRAMSGAGAALLAAAAFDALTHDNRDRFLEYLHESGAIDRMFRPHYDVPADFEEWRKDAEARKP